MIVDRSALLTDLYQLTMLKGYFDAGMTATAVFEFFTRRLPEGRNFLLAAGLEQVLDFLEGFQLSEAEAQWLRRSGRFDDEFVDRLAELRFTGNVHAMPEGTPFFGDEPILRVMAPMPEAQWVESRLINLLQFQTLIASKAARSALIAPGKTLVDFGMRRSHGAEAGLLAARASYLAGLSGTATVAAGMHFGIPIYGTMAHSFIQAHDDEMTAFENFASANPGAVVLLIDTYDTEEAAAKVVELAPRLAKRGIRVQGVRLDSGDLAEHARRVRKILDDGSLKGTTIFASGGLDEAKLAKLIASGAPIDGYGIGTRLDVSADAPYLDCAYKLEEYAGRPRRKKSEGKATWPGRKQVFRKFKDGVMAGDVLALEDEQHDGEPLLKLVMKNGRRVAPSPSLDEVRSYAAEQLARLPEPLRKLDDAPPYSVTVSQALKDLAAKLDAEQSGRTP